MTEVFLDFIQVNSRVVSPQSTVLYNPGVRRSVTQQQINRWLNYRRSTCWASDLLLLWFVDHVSSRHCTVQRGEHRPVTVYSHCLQFHGA